MLIEKVPTPNQLSAICFPLHKLKLHNARLYLSLVMVLFHELFLADGAEVELDI